MKKHFVQGNIFKNSIFVPVVFLTIFLSQCIKSFAGEIPEALLTKDYPVYFGEVKSVEEESITIIQRQHIKGEFTQDSEITYPSYIFMDSPNAGQIYLCGYFDENNPLYIWEVDCCDTSSLTISNKDNMSKRMQQYLNEGLFEDAEADRIARLEAIAAKQAQKEESGSVRPIIIQNGADGGISVIGSADGPTAVFSAAKFGRTQLIVSIGIATLVIFTLVSALMIYRKRSRR